MRRQLNIKAAGLLLALLVVVGISLAAIHGFQAVRHADGLLRQADRAVAQNRPDEALRYYKHYLSYRSDDTDARTRYALALEKNGRRPDALLELYEVLRREPGQTEVRYRLIQCLAVLKRLPEMMAQAELLRPVWPQKGEIEHILGWGCEAQRDYEKASEWFAQAVDLNPRQMKSYVILADIFQDRLDHPKKARKVMDDLVKANDNSYGAFLRRREFLLKRDLTREAELDLKRALELGPHEPEVLLAAADSAQRAGRLDEARSFLSDGLEHHPQLESLYDALAHVEIAAGKGAAARTILERGLVEIPQSWPLLLLLTEVRIDEGSLEAARQSLADLRRLNPTSPLPDYFDARLLIERQKWSEAILLLERVRGELPDASPWTSRVLVRLGSCYRQIGDVEQQLLVFRQAVNREPTWPIARQGQAAALLALGRLDEALKDLRQVTASANVPSGAWCDLVRCLVLLNLRQASRERERAETLWAEVDQAFAQAAKVEPRSVAIVILQAEIQTAQKHFAEAQKILEAARSEFPKSETLECALADLALRQHDFARALALLDQAEKNLGNSLEVSQARLGLWSRQATGVDRTLGPQRISQARQAVTEVGQKAQSLAGADRARLLRDLAETWTLLGASRSAEQTWQRLVQEQPNDHRARLSLIEFLVQGGKVDEARQTLTVLDKLEGDKAAFGHYGQALLLVAESSGRAEKLSEARKRLGQAHNLRPDWGRPPLLEATIDELEGKIDQAIQHYRQAFDLGERTPRIVYRLVQLLQGRRHFSEAGNVLAAFEMQSVLSPDLARMGADIALAGNKIDRALALSRLAVPGDSRDYRDFLWLAHVYQQAERDAKEPGPKQSHLQEADTCLRQATALAPHAPDTWIALVEHLVRTDRAALIPEVLQQAKKTVPTGRLPLTLAHCYEVMGRHDEAESFFREALSQNQDDFILLTDAAAFFRHIDEPGKAEPLLHQLLDSKLAVPLSIQAQARRDLALIVAARGRPDNVKQALDLLGQNGSLGISQPADDRVRALVLGFDPAQRDQAIRMFERASERQAASADELFHFVKLCEAAGNQAQARQRWLELVTTQPDNPQFLAHYVRSRLQLRPPDLQTARTYFERLQKLEPDSARTRELRGMLKKVGR